jgi:hypothetical protein
VRAFRSARLGARALTGRPGLNAVVEDITDNAKHRRR